jgi:hypothetical protein
MIYSGSDGRHGSRSQCECGVSVNMGAVLVVTDKHVE